MTDKKFFRVQLKNVASDQQDLLTAWVFAHGASGTAEVLSFEQSLDDYAVHSKASEHSTVEAFFSTALKPEALAELAQRWPHIEIEISEEDEKDWLAEWKKGFAAFELVAGVWVVPHWLSPPPEAQAVIRMEPGMAFGTGTHETTQVAAQLLAQALTGSEASVLDVGTGTGILALLARRLGALRIEATDIDPEAVRVANENFGHNEEPEIRATTHELEKLTSAYDLVVANIIDGVLVALQNQLKRLVRPGGSLILSGIIDERWPWFAERFLYSGFQVRKTMQLKEWHGLWLIKDK